MRAFVLRRPPGFSRSAGSRSETAYHYSMRRMAQCGIDPFLRTRGTAPSTRCPPVAPAGETGIGTHAQDQHVLLGSYWGATRRN